MPARERRFAVHLGDRRVGTLTARDDYTWFVLDESYREDPARPVLGLQFEEDLHARHSANLRLPPWFSNLLPEGRLRDWIAQGRGVSVDREMELLAEVGGDLPGAVVVRASEDSGDGSATRERTAEPPRSFDGVHWRFSLAGVQLKLSMLSTGDRFTAPAGGEGGEWIVKLPDRSLPEVPLNEFAMMELARRAGLEVPETRWVHRDAIADVPDSAWPEAEEHAYAVRRFDRNAGRRIHMEDLAQVRGFYPTDKYRGTYETLASFIYRRHDEHSLRKLVRQLAFCVLIRNGDAHLKNWSLIYQDPRKPTLAPAYDLVCTAPYRDDGTREDLALKLGGTRNFDRVRLSSFRGMQRKLEVGGPPFEQEVSAVAKRVESAWPEVRELLRDSPLADTIGAIVTRSVRRLQRS